ncbi:MAG: hypothetical protein K6T65_11850 [Peptococcaceae bacterium]|nr:hypothetical protein [Peptococcaceae bacterium]
MFTRFLSDRRGSAFIENGLWIIVVVLLVAGAGYALANDGIKAKFDGISSEVRGISIPSISGD